MLRKKNQGIICPGDNTIAIRRNLYMRKKSLEQIPYSINDQAWPFALPKYLWNL